MNPRCECPIPFHVTTCPYFTGQICRICGSLGHDQCKEETQVEKMVKEVIVELTSAFDHFPPMRSAHEGYAIILEELDELWDAIKNNKDKSALAKQRKEAIQVAAMAMRFILDISDEGLYQNGY